jgi:hypothetical protein
MQRYFRLVTASAALMLLSSCGTDRSSSYALNVFVTGLHESLLPRPQDTVSPPPVVLDGPLGASTAHEIAFLINEKDKRAFAPAHQVAWANAFYGAGLPSSSYEVDVLAVTLDNIIALGNSHPLDYLNIATHGAPICAKGGPCDAFWVSNQPSGASTYVRYFDDIKAKRVGHAASTPISTD